MQLTELMNLCTNLQKRVLDLEKAKTAQAKKIVDLKKKVKKLERKKKSRTLGLKYYGRLGRMIDNIDQDEEIALVDKSQGIMNEEEMFGVNDLDSDEVIVDATAGEEVEHSTKVAEKEDELTLAQILIEIKAAKPKARGVIVQEPSEFRTTLSNNHHYLHRLKKREKDEANIVLIEQWDEVQAKIDADIELAQKLQTEEQEQLTDAEKARLFMEFLNKIRKFFARKREIEKRNIPPTKAQQKNLMFMKRVNTFMDINTEIVEEMLKKAQAEVTEEDRGVASIVTSSSSSETISKQILSSAESSSFFNFYLLALSCSSSSLALLKLPSVTSA
nr:hypothetical protein [Tanacetum cinerariifolium]